MVTTQRSFKETEKITIDNKNFLEQSVYSLPALLSGSIHLFGTGNASVYFLVISLGEGLEEREPLSFPIQALLCSIIVEVSQRRLPSFGSYNQKIVNASLGTASYVPEWQHLRIAWLRPQPEVRK